jgi:hypothetical protein
MTAASLVYQVGGDAGQATDVPLFGEDAHQIVVHDQAVTIIFSALSSPRLFRGGKMGPFPVLLTATKGPDPLVCEQHHQHRISTLIHIEQPS